MQPRRIVVGTLVAALALGACSKKEPEQPAPVEQTDGDDDAARRRAEEEARRRAEEDARRRAEEADRASREALENARAVLTERIHFDYDESGIDGEAQDILVQKVAVLRANADVRLRIAGHADERGSIEYNLALGMRRANSARDFLTGYGLDGVRFETVSFGEEQPLVNGQSESAFAQNRRAEFTVVAGSVNAPAR